MIDLYAWNTPNGIKPLILLEELGLPYAVHPIDIGAGDQHRDAFLAINPNGRIPAMVDGRGDTPFRVFESGAMLLHLAEQSGRFLPTDPAARAEVMGWVFWQVGGVGPMLGQWGHFARRDEKLDYAIERYLGESFRLFEVLEAALQTRDYVAGAYSIADMMLHPWVSGGFRYLEGAGVTVPELPQTRAWVARIAERPAVKRAAAVAEGLEAQREEKGLAV